MEQRKKNILLAAVIALFAVALYAYSILSVIYASSGS
jgi:hypothetical protein